MKIIKKAALLLAAVITISACGNGEAGKSEKKENEITSASAAVQESETQTETSAETSAATSAETSSAQSTDGSEQDENTDGKTDTAALLPEGLEVRPSLWKATDPATGNSIYLMGTIHVAAENTYPLPDYIEQVYNDCSGIAVEYDIEKLTDPDQLDQAALREYSLAHVYRDGTKLSDHLSEDTYSAVKEFAGTVFGGWSPLYDYYNIGYWVSALSAYQVTNISGFDIEKGIDRYFIAKAKADGKTVTDIEPLSVNTATVAAYTDTFGGYILSENLKMLDKAEEYAEVLAELYILWAKGDVDGYAALNEEAEKEDGIPPELKKEAEYYIKVSVYDRNEGMAEQAAEFIRNGDNVFFMVGFAHFAGDKGIPALLTNMGFTVERLH